MKKFLFIICIISIFLFSIHVSAKDVQIFFITEGGSTNTSGFKIIDDYVNKTDGSYCATYKSNEIIKTLNSINGASFSIYKKGTNLVSGKEWYTYNYSNNKLYYFNQSKSYNVDEVLQKLSMSGDPYPSISLFAHWKGDGVDGGVDIGGASNSSTIVKTKSISLSGSNKITKGKSTTLKVTYKPSNAKKETITWSSSNKKIASVNSSGKVTGISKGTVTITAKTSSGKVASFKITISEPNYVYIRYNTNGGFLVQPYMDNNFYLSSNNVYYKKNRNIQKIMNGEKLDSNGLFNYDNGKLMNIKKNGFLAKKDAEWNTKSDGSGKSYSQNKIYSASDFCNSSNKSCVVTLYVNWKKENIVETNEQKALVQAARAYYRKGKYLQYCTYRSTDFFPEEATTDTYRYLVCSKFIREVYLSALNYDFDFGTANLESYVHCNKNDSRVIKHYEKNELKKIKSYSVERLFTELDVKAGDVLNFNKGGAGRVGHIVFIGSRMSNGDYEVYESIRNYQPITKNQQMSKLTFKGLSYSKAGTVNKRTLKEYLKNYIFPKIKDDSIQYMTLFRPLEINNHSFTKAVCNSESVLVNNSCSSSCTISSKTYSLTAYSDTRLKYKDLDLAIYVKSDRDSKLTNLGNVHSGDVLTYSIRITNHSSSSYNNLNVQAFLDDNVSFLSSIHGIFDNSYSVYWNINLAANSKIVLTYKVKVLDKIGNIIQTYSKIDNIKSASIKNPIAKELSVQSKNKLVKQYNISKNSMLNDLSFIQDIYLKSLGIDLKLNNLKLENLILKEGNYRNGSISLNSNSYFKQFVLNNYYNTLDIHDNVNLTTYGNSIFRKSKGMPYVLEDHFQIGDILVYINKDDPTLGGKDCMGICSFIYLGDGLFKGKKNNKEIIFKNNYLNSMIKDNMYTDTKFITLLGKDYYVILRPGLVYGY